MNSEQLRTEVTSQIIQALESGDSLPPWRKPWNTINTGPHRNLVSGKPYSGVNPLILEMASQMVIEPMTDEDLENMMLCLRLKIEQHPKLREMLIESGDAYIVEDCTNRQRGSGLFWGAALIEGHWVGENWLGELWMELRAEMVAGLATC